MDKIKDWYYWNSDRYGFYQIDHAFWYVHNWLFPHNVIKVRSLKRSWYDTDGKIEAVLPQLFIDFVEQEKPFEHFDTEESAHKANWIRIKSLYYWWKYIGPEILKQRDFHKSWTVEETCDKILTQKLCEIIELRGHYWT